MYRKCELFRKMVFHLRLAADLLATTGHPLNGLAVLKSLVHLYDGTATLASEPSYAALVSQAAGSPGGGPDSSGVTAEADAAELEVEADGGDDDDGDADADDSRRSRPQQVPSMPGNAAVSAKETALRVWPRLQIALLQELIRLCDTLEGKGTQRDTSARFRPPPPQKKRLTALGRVRGSR